MSKFSTRAIAPKVRWVFSSTPSKPMWAFPFKRLTLRSSITSAILFLIYFQGTEIDDKSAFSLQGMFSNMEHSFHSINLAVRFPPVHLFHVVLSTNFTQDTLRKDDIKTVLNGLSRNPKCCSQLKEPPLCLFPFPLSHLSCFLPFHFAHISSVARSQQK